jgi:hypothetical protein
MSKRCQFCRKPFATQRSVNQHISASKICLKEWQKDIDRINDNTSPKRRRINSPEPNLNPPDLNPPVDLPDPDPAQNFDDANNQANVDEVDDSDDVDLAPPKRYVEPFPGPAGDALRREKTGFETLEGVQRLEGKPPWEPFASRAEWELAEWLMKNVGQRSTNEYLKLPIVS